MILAMRWVLFVLLALPALGSATAASATPVTFDFVDAATGGEFVSGFVTITNTGPGDPGLIDFAMHWQYVADVTSATSPEFGFGGAGNNAGATATEPWRWNGLSPPPDPEPTWFAFFGQGDGQVFGLYTDDTLDGSGGWVSCESFGPFGGCNSFRHYASFPIIWSRAEIAVVAEPCTAALLASALGLLAFRRRARVRVHSSELTPAASTPRRWRRPSRGRAPRPAQARRRCRNG
jgi:hypothetical protein